MQGPKSRWVTAAVALLTAALVAAGCGADSAADAGDNGGLAAEQVLRLNIGSDPEGFDPATAVYLDTFNVLTALWAPLYRVTGEHSELTPFLATKLPEISDDGLTYTVPLRDDAVWSDGEPITAEDVVFGVRRSLDPKVDSYYAGFLHPIVGACEYNTSTKAKGERPRDDEQVCGTIDTDRTAESVGVRAVDDHTVEFKLERPTPWFDQLLSLGVAYAQPQHTIEKFGSAWTEPENLVASGPFKLASYEAGERIEFVRNPQWWGAEDVTLERIVMRMIAEPAAAIEMFEDGELDTGFPRNMIPPTAIDQWKAEPEYRDVRTTATQYLHMNTRNPALQDPKVRQGIALAINRQAIVENITRKGDRPTDTVIPDNMPGYDAIAEAAQDFLPTDEEPDVDAAREALEEGGWNEGTELSLYYASDDANTQAIAESIKADLDKVGVVVKLVPLLGDQIQQPGIGKSPVAEKVDLLLQGWIADYLDAQNFYQLWTCDSVAGGLNTSNYCNEEYDNVYGEAVQTVDFDSRVELYKVLEGMLTGPDGDMPAAPLYQEVDNTLVREWVLNFEILPSGYLYYENVQIEQHTP